MSRELQAFVDSLAPFYPGGLAIDSRAAISSEPGVLGVSRKLKTLLITECMPARRAEVGELLNNIITKGLRLELSDAAVVVDGITSEDLRNSAAAIVYLCGDTASVNFGRAVRSGDQVVLNTHKAESALDSTEIKREIWGHLKQLLRVYGA